MSSDKIHQVIVHSFTMGDVEDPEIYAAGPLLEWEQSENGKWIMERAVEPPVWHQQQDYNIWGFKYVISAKLKEEDAIIWALKN